MTQFMKKAFGGITNVVGSLLEPAENPRSFQGDARETPLESLGKVQDARYEVDFALEHLESLAQQAGESLDRIESQAGDGATSQRFAVELRREVAAELSSIERQQEHLRRQQELLLLSERRLVASIRKGAVTRQLAGATNVSTQAKKAADSALRDAGPDMQRLDAVINRARAATERLEDKRAVIGKKAWATSGESVISMEPLSSEQRIVAGFEDMQSEKHHSEVRRLAEQGTKITGRLVSEYQQLDLAIRRHQGNSQSPGSRLAISAARTFRQGMQHARAALEELTQLGFDSEREATVRTRTVAEQLALAGQAESAIYRARLEFVALIKGDEDASQDDVFEALELNSELRDES